MPGRARVPTALAVVAALFACLIVVQVFLAGLGVFDSPERFATHRTFGYLIGWCTLVIVVLALVGHAGRRVVGLALLALGQMALQSVFVLVRGDLPVVAALHPVNGVLLLLVVIAIAREAWQSRHVGAPAGVARVDEEGAVA